VLARAFAVQESGMKPESLSAILKLQGSIRKGHLDVDGAAHLIAEWARNVANASGVAIGRLKGDELIYTAGSAHAASYIGRRVMAIFSTSASNKISSEILRVEDTTTDGRIESAVCRQFGVKSLLILPIYRGRLVAGVLLVLFNDAHSFQEQEIHTYWILAGLVGEAMLQSRVTQKRSADVAPAVTEEATTHLSVPPREPVNGVEAMEMAQVPPQIEKCRAAETALNLPPDRSTSFNSRILRMKHALAYKLRAVNLYPHEFPVYQRKRISGLVAALVILACTWILCTTQRATLSSVAVPPVKTPSVTTQQTPPLGAGRVPMTPMSADEVPAPLKYQTVRYAASSGQRRFSDVDSHVKHFGNDVTVRYFTPRTAEIKMSGGSEVHYVSDDVTVRYFKPGNVVPSVKPVASGSFQTVAR